MNKLSKIICLIILFSFTFSVSASNKIRCIDMFDNGDTQQISLNENSKNCHTEQDKSTDKSFNDCCQDMELCCASLFFISYSPFENLQLIQQSAQLPSNDLFVFNNPTPEAPPPKIID